ncbi:hypothetical protein [Agrobacterium rosae]|uniref:hypothetical protein n=1 Tax=Agrobacterium rosae TaxID=1972867 RepID=UPI000CD92A51|nr:hypothetical protein [Agrobacterium rosae]POO56718.1 hypothetical protein CTT39_08550 [Agrobacterium rosae]
MNLIVARLKRKSVQLCTVLSHENEILAVPAFNNAKTFAPHYKPDEEEWLKIEAFSQTEYAEPALLENINTVDMPQLTAAQASEVRFLCIIQGSHRIYQRVPASNIIKRKFIEISGQFSVVEDKKIIILNERPDAVHDVGSDVLYFMDFSKLKSFFSKIDALYREATDVEVTQFLENEIFNISSGFVVGNVSKPNRKRIALLKDKINSFTQQQIEHLMQDFANYSTDVKVENGAFQISSDHDLKLAIYCMEERFYTTPVTVEKRLANSVLQLGG